MNLALWLKRSALLTPAAPALFRGPRCIAGYRAFAARAGAIAGALRTRFGIAPGDRVAFFMTNRTEYLELLYGVWWAGAVAVPINAKLHPREAEWIVGNAGAKLVFVSDDVGAGLAATAEILPVDGDAMARLYAQDPIDIAPRGRDDLAWLFYTSGTTGKPKGVMLSNGNLHAMSFAYFADVDAVHATDTALYAAPMSHGAGLYNFMHVMKGARHAVPESGGFDAAELLDLAPRLGDLSLFAAPTMVRRLLDEALRGGRAGEGIRTIVYGGGPMYVADIEAAVAAMGDRFVQIYGQGETPMTITALSRALVADRTHPRWRERLGSVGVAQSCVDVRITDPEGRPLPPGETGEITLRGASVMLGYWENPDATAKALRDGWLFTGDLGSLDEDGFLTLRDRSKDVIISGGSNIYPREVEEVLLTHPDVAEVSVVGRPSAEWGEEVVAFLVLRAGAALDTAALDALCTGSIARFKRPKAYLAIDALPKNNYGKVLKTALRERLAKR